MAKETQVTKLIVSLLFCLLIIAASCQGNIHKNIGDESGGSTPGDSSGN